MRISIVPIIFSIEVSSRENLLKNQLLGPSSLIMTSILKNTLCHFLIIITLLLGTSGMTGARIAK